jgi:NhaA family Na+:H+ antiporter
VHATLIGGEGEGHHGLTLHFLINDVLMALFFAIAAKEVWESLLPGGALSNPKKAATPLMATLGGVAMPALLYLAGAYGLGQGEELGRGWAVPCATDIAFSYLVARFVFGDGHPAIPFLLLLAIADDAIGLVILAVAYPQEAIQPMWLLLTAGAIATGFLFRAIGIKSFWAYLLIPGIMSWISFYQAGIHAALGLVPIIPTLPHAHTDIGFFARAETTRHDTLSEFEHWWDHPVELILGLFGLVNAGVAFGNVGTATGLVLLGLVLGKPLGIFGFTWIATRLFKLEMPAGVTDRHIVTLGVVAGIGFTVALFVASAAFPVPGPIQDAAKMGALGSFASAILAFPVAWALGVKPLPKDAALERHAAEAH